MPLRSRSRQRGRHARPRPKRRGPSRWGTRIAGAVSAMVLLAGGIGHAVVSGLDGRLERVDPFHGLSHRPGAGGGTNFLVVGVDDRDDLTEEQKRRYSLGGEPCNCTDTIMLVHISADRGRASVVSIPRDTYAEFPEHIDPVTGERRTEHSGKINAAYSIGGPGLTVRTVEKLTGLRIDHYLEVDFTSFMRTIDALGGVPVCTPRPLRDERSGLDLPAGTTRLDGGEALRYVRARYLDAEGDLGRIKRQQRFLASVIGEATEKDLLTAPTRLGRVVSALLGSVRADRDFGADDLLALGRAMRGFTTASAEFASVPLDDPDHTVPGVGSTVVWNDEGAERLFTALRRDRPLTSGTAKRAGREGVGGAAADAKNLDEPPGGRPERTEKPRKDDPLPVEVDPARIRVRVENGTSDAALGDRVDRALRATGFDTTGAPRAAERRDVEHTVIRHDPGWDRSARALATALPGARLKAVKGQGPVLEVVLGDDRQEVRRVRPAPADGTAPAASSSASGSPSPSASPSSSPDGGGRPAKPGSGGVRAVTGDEVACP
ncbi:LytR family transcriptional regulator [Streptomyces sp. TRM43335]|uniref:LytR family transcriptional regulator n=1 Tax=Streptomyces taklimakanensis TaxID=2569853 RepID=A0A6G2BB74_9ACTN|nr:LCP family protein [Streptomyces taklimakanensis]MTE19313.1 LytR family transcriptional regulator [Streptomyces taklimakanensis]